MVPVGDNHACCDGSEDSVAKSSVAPENGDGDDVEDQNKDGEDELSQAEAEGIGRKGDDLFARHCGCLE